MGTRAIEVEPNRFIEEAVYKIKLKTKQIPEWLPRVPTLDKSIFTDDTFLEELLEDGNPKAKAFWAALQNSEIGADWQQVKIAVVFAASPRILGQYLRIESDLVKLRIGDVRKMYVSQLERLDDLNYLGRAYVLKKLFK